MNNNFQQTRYELKIRMLTAICCILILFTLLYISNTYFGKAAKVTDGKLPFRSNNFPSWFLKEILFVALQSFLTSNLFFFFFFGLYDTNKQKRIYYSLSSIARALIGVTLALVTWSLIKFFHNGDRENEIAVIKLIILLFMSLGYYTGYYLTLRFENMKHQYTRLYI